MTAPSVVVVTGASGAGKTAAVKRLESRSLPGVHCFYFDSIGVPAAEVMVREFGSGEAWQLDATSRWLDRLAAAVPVGEVGVLEGQTRPSFVRRALRDRSMSVSLVLLDCRPEVRAARLGMRGQPELADVRMQHWAVYLRGQADALDLPVIDTSDLKPEEVADAIARVAAGSEGW